MAYTSRLRAACSDKSRPKRKRGTGWRPCPIVMPRNREVKQAMTERFYSKVRVSSSGCHIWTAALSDRGYGRFLVDGKNRHAHRIAWELANGPIPRGLWVLHHCDNPRCVNPAHLFLGDVVANVRDMIAKGRNAPRHGEHGGKTILTSAQVLEIRQWPRTIHVQRQLALKFLVSVAAIKAVQYRRNWRHL